MMLNRLIMLISLAIFTSASVFAQATPPKSIIEASAKRYLCFAGSTRFSLLPGDPQPSAEEQAAAKADCQQRYREELTHEQELIERYNRNKAELQRLQSELPSQHAEVYTCQAGKAYFGPNAPAPTSEQAAAARADCQQQEEPALKGLREKFRLIMGRIAKLSDAVGERANHPDPELIRALSDCVRTNCLDFMAWREFPSGATEAEFSYREKHYTVIAPTEYRFLAFHVHQIYAADLSLNDRVMDNDCDGTANFGQMADNSRLFRNYDSRPGRTVGLESRDYWQERYEECVADFVLYLFQALGIQPMETKP